MTEVISLIEGIDKTHGIYLHSCINCGGETEDYYLSRGLPCSKCIGNNAQLITLDEIYEVLKSRNVLSKDFEKLYLINKRVEEIKKLFKILLDSRPWSAQKTWAIRVLKGVSFSIVAPTGVGKTLFGMIMSIYLSGYLKWGKSYIIVPTTPLVIQVYERIKSFLDKLNLNIKVVYYHSRLKAKERREITESIKNGDFDILITTNQFISRRFDLLEGKLFKFIFVDDVDAILRSSKNIEKVLMLLGFTKEAIDASLMVIKLQRELTRVRDEESKNEILNEINELKKKYARGVSGILIVSSATGRPRGMKVKLFKELLGFQVGYRPETLRNITDTYLIPEKSIEEEVYDIVSKMGTGGLVFVPVDKGVEYAKYLAEYLSSRGIKADYFTSNRLDALEKFKNGEVDVLVGVAIYYGVLVRGLDLPMRIRYAVFAGVPRFKFSARFEEPKLIQIIRTLGILKSIVPEDEVKNIDDMLRVLNRLIKMGSYAALEKVSKVLTGEEPPTTKVEMTAYQALNYIRSKLKEKEVREKLKKLPDIQVVEEGGEYYIMIPDVMTYIQASGRTSRLYAGGITKGLSVVIVDYENLLNGLIKRMKWIMEDVEWRDILEVDLEEIKEEIDRDREIVRKVITGEIKKEVEDPVKTALLLVESPNKARTIARFFGRPSIRRRDGNIVYEVSIGNLMLMITASGGHVYDLITLPRRVERERGIWHGVYIGGDNIFIPIYNSIKRCRKCGYQFTSDSKECPKCKSTDIMDSLDRVKFLRDLASEVDLVIIGTDPDVEGEKIGWDLAMLLRPYTKEIYRMEFHEVTRKAILNGLKNLRGFYKDYVEAQIVRRIEDRWIGFVLTGKLKTEFKKIVKPAEWYKWRRMGEWSAGRVQTPVLGWIIDRWNEANASRTTVYQFKLPYDISFEIPIKEIPPEYRVDPKNIVFEIEAEEIREEVVNPPPPFTTDMMIEEANKMLKIGADEIMKLAQDLFEQGLITYHRTDSNRVSDAGIQVAKEYLDMKFGAEAVTLFKPRKWGEGGAHECIRPTRPVDTETLIDLIMQGDLIVGIPLTKMHYRLYNLIFERFIASQMSPARIIKQRVRVLFNGKVVHEEDRSVEVVSKGFLEVLKYYPLKPQVKVGKLSVKPDEVITKEKFMIPAYTQGDVIREMKNRGIGRPSTYAKIIKTLLDRRYVYESKKAHWLRPSDKGVRVYEYLSKNYSDMVSEERTRLLEKYMIEIEEGRRNYEDILRELYEEAKHIEEISPELKELEEAEEIHA